MPLSHERKYKIKSAAVACGGVLFIVGITMAIAGGVVGIPLVFGVGLGIACVMTAFGIGIRERNIAGY